MFLFGFCRCVFVLELLSLLKKILMTTQSIRPAYLVPDAVRCQVAQRGALPVPPRKPGAVAGQVGFGGGVGEVFEDVVSCWRAGRRRVSVSWCSHASGL